ncbi:MAG: serine/threonine-protein kinase [Bifidobacterium aquikefiri]|uniref:non-specific serine/threonine protein kinase n=1 Tax=Bifidobacterium aquikefiri TaxID=1653207 RepID=A0A261GAT0_9BIFI|nr:serine/threonine-protein kinase [Bifidobacterium aquikefiri]OZG68528.1 Protein kinase [Bifidobacterium aquikefiri]
MDDLSMVNLQPGEQIGGYTLIAPLGGGAMGSVWKVRDDGGQLHAMKILRDSLTDERSLVSTTVDRNADSGISETVTARERLRREAMALQRVHHPGVSEIVDMELDDALAFIVTELIEGNNLRDDIADNGRYIGDDLERLAHKLMDAVHAVHRAGIVHRDIKPTNVMVAATGPILVDFGIAMGEGESHVTRTGLVMGTPGFIAPEIIDGAESSEATDWWSVAAVLAYAATGKAVFGTRPMMTVLEREASGNADLSGLPLRTQHAFRKALSPDPHARSTPEELLHAIALDALEPQVWHQAIASQESSTALLGNSAAADNSNTRTLGNREQPTAIPDHAPETKVMRPFGDTSLNDLSTTAIGEGGVAAQDLSNPRALWDIDSAEPERPKESPERRDPSDFAPLDIPDQERDAYRHRGTIVLIAIAVLMTAMFAFIPVYAFVASCIGLWICMCFGTATEAQLQREARRGGFRTKSDTFISFTTLPWHIAKSFIIMLSRALVQIIILLIVVGLTTVALSLPTTTHVMTLGTVTLNVSLPSGSALSGTGIMLAVAMLLAWLLTTSGPLSQIIHIGAGRIRGRYLGDNANESPMPNDYDIHETFAERPQDDSESAHGTFSSTPSRVLLLVWLAACMAICVALLQSPDIDWNPLQAIY